MTVDAFLQAIAAGDAERARKLQGPGLAAASLHAAAALGDEDAVRRHLSDGAPVDAKAGDPPGDPLLWLCYSPFGDEATARVLLDAGADPNTRDGGPYNLPALYAVTGHRSAPGIARLLLDAGAAPTWCARASPPASRAPLHAAGLGRVRARDVDRLRRRLRSRHPRA